MEDRAGQVRIRLGGEQVDEIGERDGAVRPRHLAGRCRLEDAVERGIVATRQLARRQMTWLRAEPGAEWVEALESGAIARIRAHVGRWLDLQHG